MAKVSKVLIVDDDIMNNFVTGKLLSNYDKNSEVISYTNPLQALDFLIDEDRKGNKLPDLIMLDINMPEINGFEFLERMKAHNLNGKTQVMMYTSSSHPDDKAKSKTYQNVIGYMEKPFSAQAYGRMLDLSFK